MGMMIMIARKYHSRSEMAQDFVDTAKEVVSDKMIKQMANKE